MQNISNLLNNLQLYIVIGLVILVIILLIMNVIIFKSLNRLERKYKKLVRGSSGKNLEDLIVKYFDKVNDAQKESENVKKMYDNLNSKIKRCIQKISIVRYRAFEDVGSDLSFSIALLDANNDGVIITGIYGRDESTTYAKPIDSGMSRYELSQEEKQVLNECINKGI
ncbi:MULTISPECIES: DUF4446 family protein [Clostridium]|jgi:hypothetical protein|uniref:DUF4446 family protein n=1 Tax=Clostridium lapidicellarium TaxID=3240931 RepID=A0ABV4DXU8_9CLOT|nr:DUF4446 family protein [uncultured Clostridium sp.]